MPSLRILFVVVILALAVGATVPTSHGQTYTVFHSFSGDDGFYPNGPLITDSAGNLYGTTYRGGAFDMGTVFKINPAGVETVLHSFTGGAGGSGPLAGLFRDSEGNFYGTTWNCAPSTIPPCGTVFKLDTSKVFSVIYVFNGPGDGSQPNSKLVSINGELYGTTVAGGTGPCSFGCGTIYKVSKTGSESVLYSFRGRVDGTGPQGLVRDSAGNLYGATFQSCTTNIPSLQDSDDCGLGFGNVFELDTHGTFKVIHTFNYPAEGGGPVRRVIRDVNGIIHGTTESGGDSNCNCGVVYRLDANGNETILHKFFGRQSGSMPYGGLLDVAGTLFGTTISDGGDLSCPLNDHCAVLFQVGKSGHYTVLHHFTGGIDGLSPVGELTLGTDGSIFGVTQAGGQPGSFGTIFKYTP